MPVPRPEPMAIQAEDRLLFTVGKIRSVTDAPFWLTHPEYVDRGTMPLLTGLPRPAIVLVCEKIDDHPMGPERHESTYHGAFQCVSEGDPMGIVECHRLASDVMRALAMNENLLNEFDEPFEGLVMVEFFGYEVRQEVLVQTGLSVATVPVQVRYSWTHDAP